MLRSVIREFAVSKDPQRLAAAHFEKTIQIWDLDSQKLISEFPTIFCSGARNLALAPDARMLVAGLSKPRGKVVAYEVQTGKELWERKFVYPSSLRFEPTGQFVVCSEDRSLVLHLDANTGATVQSTKGISQYIEGPQGVTLSAPAKRSDPLRLIAGEHSVQIDRLGFAVLDAAFSPHCLCLTEAKGPVRCISYRDGGFRWVFDPSRDGHVVRLHYSQSVDAFFGVLFSFNGQGSRHLLRFDVVTGDYERICKLDSWEEVFLTTRDRIVTSAGEIRNLSNGELVGQLAFPLEGISR
jgi:WD40 repeat protein